MTKKESLQLFEEKKVRTSSGTTRRKNGYFSIVGVCGVLTDSKDSNAYWRKLKQRREPKKGE